MTIVTKNRGSYTQESEFELERFKEYFFEIVQDSGHEQDPQVMNSVLEDTIAFVQGFPKVDADKLTTYIINHLYEKFGTQNPEVKWVVASALRRKLYKQVSVTRGFDYKDGYGSFYQLVKLCVERGMYHIDLLNDYTKEEIVAIGNMIVPERDKLLDNAGMDLLADKYLQRNYNNKILELPQERFIVAIMYAHIQEPKHKRLEYIQKAYDHISSHLYGFATPIAMNAGRSSGSLASCQVVTAQDDLKSIFHVNSQVATFSQNGSGLGIYMGFLRSEGSWIRGHKGRASGVTHPSRILSVMAEYVNQLGARNAGLALYLPVWHLDIFRFLELRLKTGSQEKRAHSIKTAVNLPDEFMRRLRARQNWTTFDPYEFKKIMGIDLNNLYDKEKLVEGETPDKDKHAFTYYYRLAEQNSEFQIKEVTQAVLIYKSIFESRLTGGTPYLFFSDTVNRLNPNSHAGMIYSSNLCSEIAQNMSPDELISETITTEGGDTIVVTKRKVGDLVTCNLTSINWAKTFSEQYEDQADDIIAMAVRLLDNTISLNRAVVPEATATNEKYRAIGIGVMGAVEYLTNNLIQWESDKATEVYGELAKRQLKAVIKASHQLAMEKGSYPVFEGSDWNTGAFFDKRGFYGDEWQEYREMASKGIRNSYLLSPAPTSSNAIINCTTPALDPPYDVVYKEKKSGIEVMRIPSNFNNKTRWYYKSGFQMDEMWAINHIAEVQKYVDQSISHNMHVFAGITAKELLRLDLGAWDKGLKTIYYTFTSTMDKPEDCVNCEG